MRRSRTPRHRGILPTLHGVGGLTLAKPNHQLGILLSFAGYTAWVGEDTSFKLAGEITPIIQILAIYFLTGALLMPAIAMLNGGLQQLSSRRPGFQLFLSFLVIATTFGSIAGVKYLSLTDFYTIFFTSPLIVTILGSLWLNEKTDSKTWLAITAGFAGAIIAVRFAGASGQSFSWIGVAITFGASLALSLSIIAVRSAPSENDYASSFWPRIAGFIACILILLWFRNSPQWDVAGLSFAALAGVMGGFGVLLTNLSLRYAPVAVVSPYHYTQIIGGAVMGYLIWHHIPALSVVIGAIIIASSGLYILRYQQAAVAVPGENSLPG